MSDMNILLVTLVMYIVGNLIAFKFNQKILFAISGLLWFVPIIIFLETSIFIVIFSVVMFIVSILLSFFEVERSEF